MKPQLLLLALVFVPTNSESQTVCFQYAGGMISCDSSRGNTLITPLTPNQGIIQGSRDGQSFLEPYTFFPAAPPPSREAFSSSRSDSSRDSYTSGSRPYESYSRRSDSSYSSEPIEPLRRLDRLDRLEPLSDPLSDPLLPLLLGE